MASFRAIIARKAGFSGLFQESRNYSRNRCAKDRAAAPTPKIAQRSGNRAETAQFIRVLALFPGIAPKIAKSRRYLEMRQKWGIARSDADPRAGNYCAVRGSASTRNRKIGHREP